VYFRITLMYNCVIYYCFSVIRKETSSILHCCVDWSLHKLGHVLGSQELSILKGRVSRQCCGLPKRYAVVAENFILRSQSGRTLK